MKLFTSEGTIMDMQLNIDKLKKLRETKAWASHILLMKQVLAFEPSKG
jgi:hypothetical protein